MIVPPVVVRRCGIFVELGRLDGQPLPEQLLYELLPELTYQHVRHLRGEERKLPDGGTRNVEVTTRRLYEFVEGNLLQTSFGLFPRVAKALARHGLKFSTEDLTPPAHPQTYVPQWERMHQVADPHGWRPRQLECLQMLAQSPAGIIAAPPAFGKSEIIARLALLYPHARIAVITKRADVAQTIERRLHKYLPSIGYYGGGKRQRGRVSVFVAKSMHRAKNEFDMVLCDEIHELAADSFAEMLTRVFFNARMFGFSASWDARADGNSARLEYLFGPQIFYMSWQEATALGLIVPVDVRWINVLMNYNPCSGYVRDDVKMRHGIWCNPERNRLAAEAARRHPDEQVLILVSTFEHAVMLKNQLPEFELCYDTADKDDVYTYQHRGLLAEDFVPMTPTRRETMRQQFEEGTLRKVIATDVWSTGVSFERLSVLIRADARSSEIMDDQAPGRVVRTHTESGKERGVVYDFWDMFDKGFLRKSQTRHRHYRAKSWQQERERILGDQG